MDERDTARAPGRRRRRASWRTLTLGLAALGIGLGANAWAATPDKDGVIHACYDPAAGKRTLYVADPATDSCDPGHVALSWSQAGVPGPAGPQGPAGPPAATAPVVDAAPARFLLRSPAQPGGAPYGTRRILFAVPRLPAGTWTVLFAASALPAPERPFARARAEALACTLWAQDDAGRRRVRDFEFLAAYTPAIPGVPAITPPTPPSLDVIGTVDGREAMHGSTVDGFEPLTFWGTFSLATPGRIVVECAREKSGAEGTFPFDREWTYAQRRLTLMPDASLRQWTLRPGDPGVAAD